MLFHSTYIWEFSLVSKLDIWVIVKFYISLLRGAYHRWLGNRHHRQFHESAMVESIITACSGIGGENQIKKLGPTGVSVYTRCYLHLATPLPSSTPTRMAPSSARCTPLPPPRHRDVSLLLCEPLTPLRCHLCHHGATARVACLDLGQGPPSCHRPHLDFGQGRRWPGGAPTRLSCLRPPLWRRGGRGGVRKEKRRRRMWKP